MQENKYFSKPHHICIVVNDVEKTKSYYESIGIGPWMEYPPLVEYTNLNVMDEKAFFACRFVYTKIGDLQLQLVQPGEGRTIYREFLEKKGEGVFHIGFEVANISVADEQLTGNGLKILASGRRDDGSGFAYLDTRENAGVTLLIRQTKKLNLNFGVNMPIRLCLAGATGWAGSALALALAKTPDIQPVSAVSRAHAHRNLAEVLGEPPLDCPIYATAEAALAHPCDVFFEYTKPDVAKSNVLVALRHGAHVVIGTSGLTEEDFAEIAAVAEQEQKGVLAVGNFALTVVLLQKFAEFAARYIPQWEIIDYASDHKNDSPSGTVRELVHRLSAVRPSELTVPLEQTQGIVETRGARMNGSQVHSIRLPGYAISAEIIFAMPDQKLSIRHDSGSSAQPYIDGALLAIRKVSTFTGLRRGLDTVLEM